MIFLPRRHGAPMSSENREINPKALEREVPPLNSRRGPPAGSSLKSASYVQQTQKSFSRLRSLVPSLRADVMKRSRRSSGELESTWLNSGFILLCLSSAACTKTCSTPRWS